MSLSDALNDLRHEVSMGADAGRAIAEIAADYDIPTAKLAKAWELAPKGHIATVKEEDAARAARHAAEVREINRQNAQFANIMRDFLREHPQHVETLTNLMK